MKSVDFGESLNRKPSIPSPTKKGRTPASGGKGSDSMCLKFEAATESRVLLPEIVGLNQCANEFMVECWVKTTVSDRKMTLLDISDNAGACRFAIHLNANTFDELSPGVTRLVVQDSLHKAVEGHILYDHLFDGSWHLLQCHVVNARENKLDIRIDGIPMRMFTSAQSDEPFSFSSWHPKLHLGTEVSRPAGNSYSLFFDGMISEVRLWDMSSQPRSLIYRAPLTEGTGTAVSNVANYSTTTSSDNQVPISKVGEIFNAEWVVANFPPTALKMTGFHAINVGTLGNFGETGMQSFCIELWMRTKERQRPMSLLKLTDSQKKHMSLGITVNEPEPDQILFELSDSKGESLSCVWTPGTGQEVTDGQWHTIQWKVTDSTSNSCYAKIDESIVDTRYLTREGPSAFIPLHDYLALGAHNNRGRLESFFDGMLRHVILSTPEAIIAAWELNEGPGARLAIDGGDPLAGNNADFHHGVYLTSEKMDRRTSLERVKRPRIKHWTEWIKCEVPDSEKLAGAMLHQLDKKELANWASNTVRAACVCVQATPKDESNNYRETLYDILHSESITLLDNDMLPESVWSIIDDTDNLIECFYGSQHQLESDNQSNRSHNIWLIGVGDSITAIFDLSGLVMPSSAVFDPLTASWHAAVTNLGKTARSSTCLNRATTAVQNCLSVVGSYPQVWKPRGEDKQLKINSIPWNDSLVTRLLRNYSLASTEARSNLYVFHTAASNPERFTSKSELSYTISTIERIKASSIRLAVSKLQNLAKDVKRRKECRDLRNKIRHVGDRRRKSIALREEYPSAAEKKNRVALIISSWHTGTGVDEDTHYELVDNANKMSEVLSRNGFTICRMDSLSKQPSDVPTKKQILQKLTQLTADDDTMLVIYIASRVGTRYTKKPVVGFKTLHILDSYGSGRDTIIEEEIEARSRIGEVQRRLSKTPVPPNHSKPKNGKRYSRVVAGSGGAGVGRSVLVNEVEKTEVPQGDPVIVLAAERAQSQQEESASRTLIDEEECIRFSLLLAVTKEVIDRERAVLFSTPDKAFLCFDDCVPSNTTPSNSLTLSQLISFCLPKSPTIGVHRTLLIDNTAWSHIQTSGGETLHVKYERQNSQTRIGNTMTLLFCKGLWGAAQPESSPLVLEEERNVVDQHAFVLYLSKKIKASRGQKIITSVLDGELVGDAVLCPKIHMTALDLNKLKTDQKKVESDSSTFPTNEYHPISNKLFWIHCGLDAGFDVSTEDFTEPLMSTLREIGAGKPSLLHIISLPVLDFIVPSSLESLSSTVQQHVMTTLGTMCEEEKMKDSERQKDSESSEGVSSREITITVLSNRGGQETIFRVQKRYKNEEADRRWLLPPSALKLLHADMSQFVSGFYRRWCFYRDSYSTDTVLTIDVQKFILIRCRATALTVNKLLKHVRCGDWNFFNDPSVKKRAINLRSSLVEFSLLEVGSFTGVESTEFERKTAMALEHNRQLAADSRRRKEAQDKALRLRDRNNKAALEQKSQITEKLKANKIVTSPADLKNIFGLQDPVLLSDVAVTLLCQTALPYMSPLTPGPEAGQTPRGMKYIKQLVDWGIYDVLSRVFEQGTGIELGVDNPETTTVLLKLLLATAIIYKNQFMHDNCMDTVIGVLRYHLCDPLVVRWGLLIVVECSPKNQMTTQLSLAALHYVVRGMGRNGSELSRNIDAIIVSLRGIKLGIQSDVLDEHLLQSLSMTCFHIVAVSYDSVCNSVGEKFDKTLLPLLIEMSVGIICSIIEISGEVARVVFGTGGIPRLPEVSFVQPSLTGPGVVQCADCSVRFVHGGVDDGECKFSTLPTRKHTAVKINLADITLDDNFTRSSSDVEGIRLSQFVSNVLSSLDVVDNCIAAAYMLLNLLQQGTDLDATYSSHVRRELTTSPEVLSRLLPFCVLSNKIKTDTISLFAQLLVSLSEDVEQSDKIFIDYLRKEERAIRKLEEGLSDDVDLKNISIVKKKINELLV